MGRLRRHFLATVSLAVLSGNAFAADLRVPTKAPPVPPPLASSWTGPYIGLNLGAARHRWSFVDVDDFGLGLLPGGVNNTFWSDGRTGFTFGGQIGYNWQFQQFVVGLEADLNWIDGASKAEFSPVPIAATTKLHWMSTARGRVGVTFSPVLLYVTGGVAAARISDNWGLVASGSTDFSSSHTRTAPVFGGGVEYMFTPSWTARVEALHAKLGTRSASTIYATQGYRSDFEHSVTLVRGALSFKW